MAERPRLPSAAAAATPASSIVAGRPQSPGPGRRGRLRIITTILKMMAMMMLPQPINNDNNNRHRRRALIGGNGCGARRPAKPSRPGKRTPIDRILLARVRCTLRRSPHRCASLSHPLPFPPSLVHHSINHSGKMRPNPFVGHLICARRATCHPECFMPVAVDPDDFY